MNSIKMTLNCWIDLGFLGVIVKSGVWGDH